MDGILIMNAAERLRKEMVSGGIVDREKVLATVTNGIKENGYSLVWDPYGGVNKIKYGDCNIQFSSVEEEEAIRQICLEEGFNVKKAYHPTSGRWYGYEISL